MNTECYIVTCENSIEATELSMELYKNDVFVDYIKDNIIILSKEWLDIQNFYNEKINNRINNISNRRRFKKPNIEIRNVELTVSQIVA